jgi:repressor LexA
MRRKPNRKPRKKTIRPNFSQLTQRQQEVYEFIRDQLEAHGYGPTVRDICKAFKIKSPNGVMCHLKALESKGLIKRESGLARTIQLADFHGFSRSLPMLGLVAAGSPTQAVEQQECLELGTLFRGRDTYALKVRGNSMVEDHIDDGDYVIIRKKETAENGERVVAMIDNEVTLKRFYREKDRIRLEPANGAMRPIFVHPSEAKILGVLVGVVRKC